jgi:hypothetical protein
MRRGWANVVGGCPRETPSKAALRPPLFRRLRARLVLQYQQPRPLRSVITRAARQRITDTLHARRVPLHSWTHPSFGCVHVASGRTVADGRRVDDSAGRSAEGTGTCWPRWRGASLPLCQRRRGGAHRQPDGPRPASLHLPSCLNDAIIRCGKVRMHVAELGRTRRRRVQGPARLRVPDDFFF